MKFIAGSDGRVYAMREGEWVVPLTVNEAMAAMVSLGEAIGLAVDRSASGGAEPSLPKEVTRELLR